MKFIIKAQMDLLGSGLMLIYNEDCSIFIQDLPTKTMRKAMKGEFKQYFYATVNDKGDLVIDTDHPADLQDW